MLNPFRQTIGIWYTDNALKDAVFYALAKKYMVDMDDVVISSTGFQHKNGDSIMLIPIKDNIKGRAFTEGIVLVPKDKEISEHIIDRIRTIVIPCTKVRDMNCYVLEFDMENMPSKEAVLQMLYRKKKRIEKWLEEVYDR